jgi:hypothetical protein
VVANWQDLLRLLTQTKVRNLLHESRNKRDSYRDNTSYDFYFCLVDPTPADNRGLRMSLQVDNGTCMEQSTVRLLCKLNPARSHFAKNIQSNRTASNIAGMICRARWRIMSHTSLLKFCLQIELNASRSCHQGRALGCSVELMLPIELAMSHISEKNCLVRFKDLDVAPQLVRAAKAEIHGEHLVFLRSGGELSALFLLELVQGWSALNVRP